MAVSPLKTWVAGEVLTASDLNAEFLNVYSGGQTLGWPATTSKDLNGFELIFDVDADTSLTADTDDRIDVKLSGADLFRFDGTATTPVNGFDFIAAAASSDPSITVVGSDTNIDLNIVPKGTGLVMMSGTELLRLENTQDILSAQVFA
jgi:hypothetical protein